MLSRFVSTPTRPLKSTLKVVNIQPQFIMHLMYYLDGDGKRVYTLKVRWPCDYDALLLQLPTLPREDLCCLCILDGSILSRTIQICCIIFQLTRLSNVLTSNTHPTASNQYFIYNIIQPIEIQSRRKSNRICTSCTIFAG